MYTFILCKYYSRPLLEHTLNSEKKIESEMNTMYYLCKEETTATKTKIVLLFFLLLCIDRGNGIRYEVPKIKNSYFNK